MSLRRFLPAATLALALGLSAAVPAHAAPYSFSDPEGDANALFVVESTPLPSEDPLDITSVSIASDGKKITYSAKVKAATEGDPSLATGQYWRFHFTYEDLGWTLEYTKDQLNGSATTMNADDDTAGTADNACSGCAAKIDVKTNTVTITAPIASISRTMRAFDNTVKALGPGSKFTDLSVDAQRSIFLGAAVLTPTADSATAPETGSFTL